MYFYHMKYLIILLLFCSCTTLSKFQKYAAKNPLELAKLCSEKFPPKDSLIKGKPDTITQTTQRTDTVTVTQLVNGKATVIKLPCPVCKSTHSVVTVHDTIIRVDRAKEYVIQADNGKLKSDNERLQAAKRNWMIAFAVAFIGGALGWWMKFR